MGMYKADTFVEPPRAEIIRLDKCRVRTWRIVDIDALQLWLSDPDIWTYFETDYSGPPNRDFCEGHLRALHLGPKQMVFAVAALDDNQAIGCMGATVGEGIHARTARIDGWLSKPYWRSGIPRAVTTAFADWLFQVHDIIRVYAVPFHLNRGSIGTLAASGFQCEGRMRGSVMKCGVLMDQMLYSKINPKYAQLVAENSTASRASLRNRAPKDQ